jgi:hypothetical protein
MLNKDNRYILICKAVFIVYSCGLFFRRDLHLVPKPLADEESDDEQERRHAQAQDRHLREAGAEGFSLCNRDGVVEDCNDDNAHRQRDGDVKVEGFGAEQAGQEEQADGDDVRNARVDRGAHGVLVRFFGAGEQVLEARLIRS